MEIPNENDPMSNEYENTADTQSGGDDTHDIGIRDLLVASGAGLLGILAMLPFFWVGYVLGALEPESFAWLASLVGGADTARGAFILGAIIFVVVGIVILPPLFVSLAGFLPPERSLGLRGVTFALIAWTGFVVGFWNNPIGAEFWLFLVVTALAHVAYGYVLGKLYVRYSHIPRYEV